MPWAGVIWRPAPEPVPRARITAFMRKAGVADLEALQERAAADPAWFWGLVERDLGIHWYEPYTQVLDTSRGEPWAQWFLGGRMNVAADCVDKHVPVRPDQPAVIWEGEEGVTRAWTYRELQAESNRLANGLRRLGLHKGDRVGIFLPMIPETVAAIMAVAKVGAIFTPIFSGYAAPAVATRLADAGAKFLITADGFYRRGKPVGMKAVADEALAQVPSVEKVVVVRRLQGGGSAPWTEGRDHWYHEVSQTESTVFDTEPMGAEDPLMIIYTSGTTGKPKGALHVHCSFPMKAAQDMAHLFDVGEADRLMWFSDLGWMMGPWMIFGTLMLGAACFLYDGAPDYPGPDRLWSLVERHKLTHLGVSPTLIRALMPHGSEPVERHDLSSLRMFGSTGEPWNPAPYLWLFETVGRSRCPIINYSGGTEISGGILGCVPIRALKVASFNCVVPGMAADVVNEAGEPLRGGEVGELVIRRPWVGMTRGFWQDPKRYEETYWSRIPGLWVHGDWASVDADGFWYIHGRSDDTLKVAGKRVGPAEVESALVAHGTVAEAAAIGVPHPVKGEAVVGFVVLRPGVDPSEELRQALCDRVAADLGKALRPETVKFVTGLPKTRNAKIMRRVIRAVYLGQPAGDITALENPDMVQAIAEAR